MPVRTKAALLYILSPLLFQSWGLLCTFLQLLCWKALRRNLSQVIQEREWEMDVHQELLQHRQLTSTHHSPLPTKKGHSTTRRNDPGRLLCQSHLKYQADPPII